MPPHRDMEAEGSKSKSMQRPWYAITCRTCDETMSVDSWSWRGSCGGTLRLDVAVTPARLAACSGQGIRGMTRFADVLPLKSVPDTCIGDTPLAVEDVCGVKTGLKLEYLNPGGSFKDRGAYVTVARCAELGFKAIVVDSSGNAGVAMALMGLRLHIGVDVFLPRATPEGKKRLLQVLRATIHEIDGDRMAVHEATLKYAASAGGAYAGHWWNPYFAHGVKTMAYEALEQMPSIDYVFAPVGAGTVLLGLYTGFTELVSAGALTRIPRLVAVQAAGFSPVAAALGVASPESERSHLADGIAISAPPRQSEIVSAVTQTGGFGLVVTDGEIGDALNWLTARGYVVEPTSAVPLAGLLRCIRDGRIPTDSSVLLPLTGTGMKVLDELAGLTHDNFQP